MGRHTLFLTLSGGTSFGGGVPAYDEFVLGGPFSLSGISRMNLTGSIGVARPAYLYRLLNPGQLFNSSVYLGGWLEAGNVWQTADTVGDDLIYAATLILAADTKLGVWPVWATACRTTAMAAFSSSWARASSELVRMPDVSLPA